MQNYVNNIASTLPDSNALVLLPYATCTVYEAGTLVKAALYSDDGVTPLTNPFTASSTAQVLFYAANGRYDLKVFKSGYVPVTIPNIELDDLLAPSGSNSVGYLPAGTGAVATTVQTKLRESVSVKDFGAVGNGVADDTAAIQACINAGAPSGKTIFFPAGVYRTTATVGFTRNNPQQFAFRVVGENSFYTTILADHASGPVLSLNRSLGCVSDICLNASATRTAGTAGSNYGLLMEGPDVASGAVATMTITRVRILNQPSHGLVHVGQSQLSYYEQVLCQSNKGHGFVFSDGTITSRTNLIFPGLLTLNGCWSISNTGHGLSLGSPSETVSPVRFLILNCEFSDNALTAGVRYTADEVWISGVNITIDTCAMGRSSGTAAIGCIRFAGENLFIRNQRAVVTTHTLRLQQDHILGSTTGVSVEGLRVLNNAQNPVVIVEDLTTVRDITVNTYGGSGNMTTMFTPNAIRTIWNRYPAISIVKKPSNQVVNNSTTLQDDTALSLQLGPSETVYFEAAIRYYGDSGADIKFAFVGPTGTSIRWDNANSIYITTGDVVTVSNSEITEGATRSFGAVSGTRNLYVRGYATTSTTPGLLQLQWAQNAAVAADTVVAAQSVLKIYRNNANT